MAVPKRFKFKTKIRLFKIKKKRNEWKNFAWKSTLKPYLFITYMLFWSKFLFLLLCITLLFFTLSTNSLLSVVLTMEFSIILLFFCFLFSGVIFNINWIFGFNFIIIILGSFEIALSFLLLNL